MTHFCDWIIELIILKSSVNKLLTFRRRYGIKCHSESLNLSGNYVVFDVGDTMYLLIDSRYGKTE